MTTYKRRLIGRAAKLQVPCVLNLPTFPSDAVRLPSSPPKPGLCNGRYYSIFRNGHEPHRAVYAERMINRGGGFSTANPLVTGLRSTRQKP